MKIYYYYPVLNECFFLSIYDFCRDKYFLLRIPHTEMSYKTLWKAQKAYTELIQREKWLIAIDYFAESNRHFLESKTATIAIRSMGYSQFRFWEDRKFD